MRQAKIEREGRPMAEQGVAEQGVREARVG